MTVQNTIDALKKYCTNSTGDMQIWQGNKATYHWNIGRDHSSGEVNGVVRKLAGVDASGRQIWVVAGSFKISANGEIQRFTGLSKKVQKLIQGVGTITATASAKVLETEPV